MTGSERIAAIADYAAHLCADTNDGFIIALIEAPLDPLDPSRLYVQTNIEEGYEEIVESLLDQNPIETTRRVVALATN